MHIAVSSERSTSVDLHLLRLSCTPLLFFLENFADLFFVYWLACDVKLELIA